MRSRRKVYINGIFVPEQEAKISIFDSALMFGDMVFEMTRSFNGKQWKLRRHLERLYSGIKILRIPLKMTIDEMEKACYETIEKNEPVFENLRYSENNKNWGLIEYKEIKNTKYKLLNPKVNFVYDFIVNVSFIPRVSLSLLLRKLDLLVINFIPFLNNTYSKVRINLGKIKNSSYGDSFLFKKATFLILILTKFSSFLI